ncbi:MAG: hypothetical protein RLY95_1610 [Pseudomonadota bacterium]|jgi:type IV secretion system protein VirB1
MCKLSQWDEAHIRDMTLAELVLTCAPLIHPVTMHAVVQHESGGNYLALHDNTTGQTYKPASLSEGKTVANQLVAQGHSVDIGFAQINSKNLPKLGVSVDQVMDPCTNLWAAQTILLSAWRQSQGNLPQMLSIYNTGRSNSVVGMRYAASVYARAGAVSSKQKVLSAEDPRSSPLKPKSFAAQAQK